MRYRLALVFGVVLTGCMLPDTSDVPLGLDYDVADTLTPTDPQCGACARVYVMSTQELYVQIEEGAPMPSVDLSLYTEARKLISRHQGLVPAELLGSGKAVYDVEGGPDADVAYGVITWRDSTEVLHSERVSVQAHWLGWPTNDAEEH